MAGTAEGALQTAGVLQRWATALPAEWHEVRLVPAGEAGAAASRRYLPGQLPGAAGWLRHMNTADFHVYGRPSCCRHILVDDLSAAGLASLTSEHLAAAIVETSDQNFQVWVTVSASPVDPGHASRVARMLASRHGGDPGATGAFHLGRVPGLCNRKPRHRRADGRFPWVLLRHAAAVVCPAGEALLREAAAAAGRPEAGGAGPAGQGRVAGREEAGRQASRPAGAHPAGAPPAVLRRTAQEEHAAGARALRATLPAGAAEDRSRTDFALARRLLARGVAEDHIVAVLLAGERASTMTPRVAEGYALRTVRAACRQA